MFTVPPTVHGLCLLMQALLDFENVVDDTMLITVFLRLLSIVFVV